MTRVSVLAGLLTLGMLGASTTTALAADPSQTDFDACNRLAQAKVSTPSASPQSQTQSPSPATQAAPSQESAKEASVANQADQLRGIADTYKDDAAYQQSYRDCMKQRGF
jgi:hypothetical protein